VTDPLWVDVNTHTHANWVFSAPGVYVVRLEATADLLDGSKVSDVADVRVAVGDATQIGEAAAAVFEVDEAASSAPVDGDEASAAADPESVVESTGGRTALVAAVVVAAGVLAVSVAVGVARARAARRRLVGGGRS
jgi:surface-anchored protein